MVKIRIRKLKTTPTLSNRLLRRIINKALESEGVNKGEVNLLIAGDSVIKRLNRRYLKKNKPTDVLAFNMCEGKHLKTPKTVLGDVIISVDRARVQAKRFKTNLRKELALYVIHGVLHLVGYEDKSKHIENQQKNILNKFFK